jgi:hypothetical protein
MSESIEPRRPRKAVKLAELVAGILAPVSARRGFATADLVAAWPEVVGARTASCTRPERIAWPRDGSSRDEGGVLHLLVDGPRAVLIQHETDQIIERVNAFLGRRAITRVRLIQGHVAKALDAPKPPPGLDEAQEARLRGVVTGVDGDLRAALDRLGRGVLSRR